MKITAIIVTYDNPGALDTILNSIRMQDILPDEVIIADDGSGEETAGVIAGYRQRFPCPLKHVWQENHGFRAARIRNAAIRESTGDYLLFSDGDLFWHPKFVSDFRNRIMLRTAWIGSRVFLSETASSEIIQTRKIPGQIPFYSSMIGKNRMNTVRIPFLSRVYPAISFKESLRGGLLGVGKKEIEAVNGWNESFTGWGLEDTELVARLYHSGVQLRKMKFAAICYHLWHKTANRTSLTVNRELLKRTMESKLVWCENGLTKMVNP